MKRMFEKALCLLLCVGLLFGYTAFSPKAEEAQVNIEVVPVVPQETDVPGSPEAGQEVTPQTGEPAAGEATVPEETEKEQGLRPGNGSEQELRIKI